MASTASAVSLHRRPSCDTVCSSNSSCLMQKRRPVHPLATSISHAPRNNSVQQRVLSARLLKLRSLQNKLNDANFHLAELQQENRALRNLQTRQDKALSKYEGTNADLPKLLKSYEEDVRILNTKNKCLRKSLRDVGEQLKTKEEELCNVREQLKNLVTLTKNKNLGERQTLTDHVDELKQNLKSSEEKINLLNRKLLLETKNFKSKLSGEVLKNKQRQKELSHALAEIDRLNGLLEGKGKHAAATDLKEHKRFSSNNRQSVSLTNLINDRVKPKPNLTVKGNPEKIKEDEDIDEPEHSIIKLEPITTDSKVTFSNEVTMVSPSENVRARLSASLNKEITQLTKSFGELGEPDDDLSDNFLTIKQKILPNSAKKLEKLVGPDSLHKKFDEVKREQDINKRIGNCCSEIRSTVKDCGAVVDKHKVDFEYAKCETEKLLRDLRETDSVSSKLRYSNFLSADKIDIPEKDLEIAKEIWENEYSFRNELREFTTGHCQDDVFVQSDDNGNEVETEGDIGTDEKNKLLATLRAIDNDDLDEVVHSTSSNKSNRLIDSYLGI